MTDDEIAERLRTLAAQLAAPALNNGEANDIFEGLWKFGYLPARTLLIEQGLPQNQIDKAVADFKRLADIVEPSDLVEVPRDLLDALRIAFNAEIALEPALQVQRLDERVFKEITDFRVEMFGNEGQHAGRPHVKVHLQDGPISVSLDDPPINLTPRGGMRGESSAIKVIAKYREKLLKLWHETRPDTQKLKVTKT